MVVPEEKKGPPTKMYPSGNSLFSILEKGPAAVRTMRAIAGHQDPVPTRQEEEISQGELNAAQEMSRKRSLTAQQGLTPVFHRGSVVKHIPTGKKVTILKLDASSAEVVSKSGRKWTSKLSDLK
jgi:hypothetical protein